MGVLARGLIVLRSFESEREGFKAESKKNVVQYVLIALDISSMVA